MADPIDLREVSGCTCLRARRVSRQLTQSYDRALQPVGLTVNQFGVLAKLYGATQGGRTGLPIGVLAERLGMHPTTLNRDLKPLKGQNLIADRVDATDRRVRAVTITRKGRAKLAKAVPFWRRAQKRLEETLGAEATRALNDFLDLTASRLK
ncbi:MAG TPA: MarR family winged helix-turn-helix transcriptional regulator [Xanthobacteraceae bacterium]